MIIWLMILKRQQKSLWKQKGRTPSGESTVYGSILDVGQDGDIEIGALPLVINLNYKQIKNLTQINHEVN